MFRRSGSVYRRLSHGALPVMMCVLLGACASAGAARHVEPVAAPSATEKREVPTHVVVNNRSGDRVTVFISQGSGTWRLGEVEPYSRQALPLKTVATGLLCGTPAFFIGRPRMGAPYRSDVFAVNASDGIPTWTIGTSTAFSYASLR